MPVLSVEALAKSYGGRTLFDDATFQIDQGERVGIVGPNGAGKSTLLRILAGRERPDHGAFRCDAARIHWFDQHPTIPQDATVRDLLRSPRPAPPALAEEHAALEKRIADPALYEAPGYESVLERYAEVCREMDLATQGAPVDIPLLAQLGIDDLEQSAASLSGGEKTRVFLARTLHEAQETRGPDGLLVLDEPTNHLDVDTIEWLEEWLGSYDGTVLTVAHDRVFLDNIVTRILEVRQGRITSYPGDYEDYVAAREEGIERMRRDHEKARDRIAGAKSTIMQFRHQKRFDGQYASRMKALAKYEAALESTPDPVLEKLGFGLAFGAADKSSNEIVRLQGVTKGFQEPVLQGVDLEIRKGDRVGLVGSNGSGKTTLLRILTGRIRPDAGTIHAAPGVRGAYFSQEHDDLRPERTLLEEVHDARQGMEERDVKAVLGRFRFDGDDLRRTVSTLSGGERQRMMLLKCILRPSNFLVLDEPTNHLDLWARDVVVSALRSYHGTVLVVSHDRFLLDATTDTTAILDEGHLHQYPGSFTATRDQHHRKTKAARGVRLRVRKRFTDWNEHRKYAVGEEFEATEQALAASMTLRNALTQGWLERI